MEATLLDRGSKVSAQFRTLEVGGRVAFALQACRDQEIRRSR
jgi:hypothetical protein